MALLPTSQGADQVRSIIIVSAENSFGRTVCFSDPYVASYFSSAVFCENDIEIMRVLKDIGP